MKKMLCTVMTMALTAGLLAGCGSGSQSAPATTAAAPTEAAAQDSQAAEETSAAEAADSQASGEALKIAIVSSPSGVDDGSFNEDNYNGILAFIETHPDATVTPVREETGDTAAAVQAVQDIVADYEDRKSVV